MSEQTPESSASAAEETFDGSEPEPSMEDILASIRKIIADDGEPVPMDSPEAADAMPVTPDAIKESLSKESTSFAIEAMVATHIDVTVAPDSVDVDGTASDDDALDIDALLTDFVSGDVQTITDGDLVSADDDLTIPIPATESATQDADADGSDEMDRLISELLVDMDDDVTAVSEATDGPVTSAVPAARSVDDDDMDLVKSLMADLTDEDIPTPKDIISDVAATPKGEDDPQPAAIDDLDALEDDIFDSILDMTLTAEEQVTDNAVLDGDALVQTTASSESLSLSDIAAAAEADAALEEIAADEPTQAVAATHADPSPSTPQNPDIKAMESPMPRAARSDAILDDVTEEATMSAFAQLNQVVEDKVILSERGPRIGDLVQEALKPMLKEWLDENLQGIVERAVAKEVKRIATGK